MASEEACVESGVVSSADALNEPSDGDVVKAWMGMVLYCRVRSLL